jgi:hypothetical protein
MRGEKVETLDDWSESRTLSSGGGSGDSWSESHTLPSGEKVETLDGWSELGTPPVGEKVDIYLLACSISPTSTPAIWRSNQNHLV